MKRLAISLAVLFLTAFGLAPLAHADSLAIHGLSITPDINQVTLAPDQGSSSYDIRLDNNLSVPISVNVTSEDFKSLSDSGGLLFIGTGATNKYGLANWIDLPTAPITLQPGSGQFVHVNIENRADLSSGGHYAAIIFHVNNAGGNGTNNVQLNQEISSLLFVRKTGGESYGLMVTKASFDHHGLRWPSVISLTFANTGNTQTAPAGYIDLAGQRSLLNENSSLVLPSSSRTISARLPIGAGFWPQRYHAVVHYRPDAVSNFTTYNASFYYINPWFIALCALILGAVFRIKKARRALVKLLGWMLIKLDRLVRRLEVWIPKLLKLVKKSLVWLGLKTNRQLRRLEIWITKFARWLRKKRSR